MNIHEYQAKQLLAKYGVAVPLEIPAKSLDEVRAAAGKNHRRRSARVVVKSQIHAGGRGKGTFKTGFQGGVKVAASVDEAVSHAKNMLDNVLVTKQTGPDGRRVQALLIASGAKIKGNFTWPSCSIAPWAGRSSWPARKAAWTSRRSRPKRRRRFSRNGLIRRGHHAVSDTQDCRRAWSQGRFAQCRRKIRHRRFQHVVGMRRRARGNQSDVRVELPDGKETVVALDAKISLDDNGLYRHADIQAMRDLNEETPLETGGQQVQPELHPAGRQHRLPRQWRRARDGDDGHHPAFRRPAGELPRRGWRREQGTGDGGVQNHPAGPECKEHPGEHFRRHHGLQRHRHRHRRGVKETGLKLPLVVRLEGNNVVAGKKTLAESGLKLITGDSMADAAQKVVKAVGKQTFLKN